MTLRPDLRKDLERTVIDAREAAEAGARAALGALAVPHSEPYDHMQEPVTLDECEELAKDLVRAGDAADRGIDKWLLAARFAHAMLPQVFRADLPVFEVRFAQEHRQRLEALVEGLPAEVFTASDALGWVYQFWQSRKKAEVNRSEAKIGADELPAVTQLFTEPYMVSFLLDNSLGAWWAARRLTDADFETAQSEAELRERAAIPGAPLDYLRFVQETEANSQPRWRPAAGTFDGWPEHLGGFKVLDPCCGSGHFLIAAFAMLVPMRMALEGLNAPEAVDAVIRDNLRGLEIDARCVEIAVFALALAAWRYPDARGYRPLPRMNVACSGLSVGTAKAQWTALAAGRHNLRIAMDWLYDVFKDAPTLGSLLNPAATDAGRLADWPDVSALLAEALADGESDEQREAALAASGLAKAADLLAGQYHLVATNVPYLVRGKQSEKLRQFCARYPAAKKDLATVFLERCLELCADGGVANLVLPQNWLFLTSYRKLREKLLKTGTWRLLARLGEGGFESPTAAGAFVALLTLSREAPCSHERGLLDDGSRATNSICGFDVSAHRTVGEKARQLRESAACDIDQAGQLDNPDARVVLDHHMAGHTLDQYAIAMQGVSTVDVNRFVVNFWEVSAGDVWRTFHSPADATRHYGGKQQLFRWDDGNGALVASGAYIRGQAAWKRTGLAIGQMRALPATLIARSAWNTNCAALVPKEEENLPAIWCFCSSAEYNEAVRRIDQQIKVTNDTLVKVLFDLNHWSSVANGEYPNGLPKPYSNDPTQWIFHGHPCGAVEWDEIDKRTAHGAIRTDATVLQVAVARLLGYRWPAEREQDMELAAEQREWVRACEPLAALADEDGIVCVPSVRGEPPAAERLRALLAVAYGDGWDEGVLARLLANANGTTLDDWLRNQFFEQHCKLFHNRPFIWHVWDGRKRDGFHALVSYHKLTAPDGQGRRCLESLTYSYLGDWITRQHDGISRDEPGAEDRLAAAQELQTRLDAILTGEPPYDIFIRWKPLDEQPVGWEPDINDGVRPNIRPFMANDIPGGKKGAGILRSKPNIHWRKDRGKEPHQPQDQFPWFWRDGEFTAERVNDVHLSPAEKQAERIHVGEPNRSIA